MAATPEELDEMMDDIYVNGNLDNLKDLLVPNYFRKIVRIEHNTPYEFIDYMKEYYKNAKILESKTNISIIKVFEDKALCLGEWSWKVLYPDTNEIIVWNGHWSDIKVKCGDGLWRVEKTIVDIE